MELHRPHKLLLGLALGILLMIPCWLYLVVPHFERIPSDFSTTAEIFSLDNFYDETQQKFHGAAISKTQFSYQALSDTDHENIIVVKNLFDVRTMTDEKIFQVERLYGIDVNTGQHVKGFGDQDREGYLFAPSHLQKQDFFYWHINYNVPALMKFQAEEQLFGLTVYLYAANFEADQTADLGHLPQVGKSRGVKLEINLQTWIEPRSGRMVKYHDRTLAYYYDLKTGARLHPWNQFSNRYTHASTLEQVQLAKAQKKKLEWLEIHIPFILFWVAICLVILVGFELKNLGWSRFFLFLRWFLSSPKVSKTGLYVFIMCILLFMGYVVFAIFKNPEDTPVTVGIALWNQPQYDKNLQGFKDSLKANGFVEGQNLRFIQLNAANDLERQLENVVSLVEQKVDLIYSITTPGTLAAKSVTNLIPIVFSIVTYPVEVNIIQSLESSENNLVGTRNYVPLSQQYYLFEKLVPHLKSLAFLHHKGEPNSTIQFKEMQNILDSRKIKILDLAAVDLADLNQQLLEHKDEIDVLYSACDTLLQSGGEEIVIAYSFKFKKPAFSCNLDGVHKGALAGHVADWYKIGSQAGEKAALILQGAKATWLLTESPNDYHIVINQKTATSLGIEISTELLQTAKEIVK